MANGTPKDPRLSQSYSFKSSTHDFFDLTSEILEISNKSEFLEQALIEKLATELIKNPIVKRHLIKSLRELS